MTSLPDHPDLDQLRTRAKELKRALLAGEQPALDRVLASHPKFAGRPAERLEGWTLTLRDAQATIARELGFGSWKALITELGNDDRPRWNPTSEFEYISRADAEASKLHHGYIGVLHLILALLNPPEPTVVLEVLGALGISYDDELDKVKKWNRPSRKQGRGVNPALQQLLGRCEGIAIGMGAAEMKDEHALLAILYAAYDRLLAALDPDDIAVVMTRFGLAMPGTSPPVLGNPPGPWGPWVYVRRESLSEVTKKLAELHPPGTVWWGMNKSKWKRDSWYVHGEDEIPMERIVRTVLPEPNDIEVLGHKEG